MDLYLHIDKCELWLSHVKILNRNKNAWFYFQLLYKYIKAELSYIFETIIFAENLNKRKTKMLCQQQVTLLTVSMVTEVIK